MGPEMDETTTTPTPRTVAEVAELTGVTVRTLHHYDRIGVLTPSRRTNAGHRRYGEADVQMLYRIVALRQLGLSLGHIAAVLADEEPIAELLQRQLDETTRSIRAHHELLARLQRGVAAATVRADELFDVIGGTVDLTPQEATGTLRPLDAGAASTFTMLFDGLDGAHTVLRRRLAQLTPESPGSMAAAGPHLFAALTFEDTYVMSVLQRKPTVFADQEWSVRFGIEEMHPGVALPTTVGTGLLGEYAEAVFAATTAYVTTIDEAELMRDVPGPGETALTWSMKVTELLAQVVAFSHHHAGCAAALTSAGYP